MKWRIGGVLAAAAACSAMTTVSAAWSQPESAATVTVRGTSFTVRTFGARGRPPIVVTSGDGGWIHLAPHIASVLASRGFFVVGFDAREYLSRFTSATSTLSQADVPGDYRVVVDFAAAGSADPPILLGVSEGAGLSVLAATREDVRQKVRGVIGVGLPDVTELAWHLRDTLIYFTHRTPNEPTFRTSSIVDAVSPVPIAAIHSTRDEYVPLDAVKAVMSRAREPKRLWTIDAADHAFTDKRPEFDARLLEAIGWITAVAGRPR